jgi:hypothetical protein
MFSGSGDQKNFTPSMENEGSYRIRKSPTLDQILIRFS